MIFTFITYLLALGPVFCEQYVKDNFKFCTFNDNSPILSTSRLCSYNTFESNFHSELYNVLEKTPFYINGNGFMCTRDKIDVRTYETFFGQRIHERMVTNEKLSREECLALIKTRKCYAQEMECINNNCKSIEEPKVSYSWLKELPFSSYHCTTYKIPIRGYTADEKLYGNSQSSCLPRDLFCQVEGSTYIWEKDIIHECPFSYLASLKECGMELLTTTEGLYLTKNNESQKLPLSENDLNTEHQLMLTDIDYK
ncbi:hypothetical protein BpHYR1_016919, partial [Brachionus plicatilis]